MHDMPGPNGTGGLSPRVHQSGHSYSVQRISAASRIAEGEAACGICLALDGRGGYDAEVDKWHHPVENHFVKIKEFRGIATTYYKTDCSYATNTNPAPALIASR